MKHYRIGDELVCSFNMGDETSPWIQKFKVQVLGFDDDEEQALCYVPQYMTIKNSFKITGYHQKICRFHSKFLNEQGVWIRERQIDQHLPSLPGETCSRCGLHVQYAETDDVAYTCRACRENPWR